MIDYSKLPRAEKLYVLSQVCIINSVTPNTPGFVGLVIRVCTSKFAMSKETAKEYADTLKSAYEADQWKGLADKHEPDLSEREPETYTPRVFEEQPKTLDALNSLNFKSSEPIKRVEPKKTVIEPEYAPVTTAKMYLDMARENDFNGVGRINLAEARHNMGDKTIQCTDIISLITQYYPKIDVEQRAGNNLLVYFDGKNSTRDIRDLQRQVQPKVIIIHPETFKQLNIKYFKDSETADTDNGVPTGNTPDEVE